MACSRCALKCVQRRIQTAAILALALASVPALAQNTQKVKYDFTAAKRVGNVIVRLNGFEGHFAISVTVPIPQNLVIDAPGKRDLLKAKLKEKVEAFTDDDAALQALLRADIFQSVDDAPVHGFTVGNIPNTHGNNRIRALPVTNPGLTGELSDAARIEGPRPNCPDCPQHKSGKMNYDNPSFDPNDGGQPARFKAGIIFDGAEYVAEVNADELGGDYSGENVAHELWVRLAPQVQSIVDMPDPFLSQSDALRARFVATAQTELGVIFGTTSPSEGVSGEIVGEPSGIPALSGGGLMVASAAAIFRQR